MAPKQFPALPGFYYYWFLYIEPLSTFVPAITCLLYPGTAWFYHIIVPSTIPANINAAIPDRAVAAVWQLANSYMLAGLLQSIGYRAVRDALPNNPAAQERIIAASLAALAIADVIHVTVTFLAAPADIRFDLGNWTSISHGNTTGVAPLLLVRLAWFAGIGRTRYYLGS